MQPLSLAAHADLDLIVRAASGARAARTALARRLDPTIRARVARVLQRLTPAQAGDADDIAQQVWCTLLKDDARQLRAYEPGRGISLEAYVGMVAEREVRNHIAAACTRKRGADRRVTLTDAVAMQTACSGPTPEASVMTRDLVDRLGDVLAHRFPERALNVMSLCMAGAEAPNQAASALNMPSQQVYNWMFQLRRASREFLTAQAA